MMRSLNAWRTLTRRAGLLAILLCLFSLGQSGARLARADMSSTGAFGIDAARTAPAPAPSYVPPPARQYGLNAADAPGFTMIKDQTTAQGRSYESWILAPDAKRQRERTILSNTDVSLVVTNVTLDTPDSAGDMAEKFSQQVESLTNKHGAVATPIEPQSDGWRSDQITMVTWTDQDLTVRGYVLRYGTAIVRVEGHGKEPLTTWDRVKSLARIVEGRLQRAAQ
jgi:hypothetical protein